MDGEDDSDELKDGKTSVRKGVAVEVTVDIGVNEPPGVVEMDTVGDRVLDIKAEGEADGRKEPVRVNIAEDDGVNEVTKVVEWDTVGDRVVETKGEGEVDGLKESFKLSDDKGEDVDHEEPLELCEEVAVGEALRVFVVDGEGEGAMRSAAAGTAMPWKLYCEGAVATIPHTAVSVLNTRAWVGVVT